MLMYVKDPQVRMSSAAQATIELDLRVQIVEGR